MNIDGIQQLSNLLKEIYPEFQMYLSGLTILQITEFCDWFNTQLPDGLLSLNLEDLSEEQLIQITQILKSQKKYMEVAPWLKPSTPYIYSQNVGKYPNIAKMDVLFVYSFSFFCAACVFSYIFLVTLFGDIIVDDRLRFVDQSLGNMYAILNTIIGFYFGSAYTRAKMENNNYSSIATNTTTQKSMKAR